jgi:type IV secretion system protein VirB10
MKINRLHRNFISMLLPVVWCVPLLAQDAGPLAATPPATSELDPPKPPRPAPHTAAPAAVQTAAVETKAPAKIEVPTGTHIPLVLHNGISTRSARPGDPVYFETLFPVMIDGRVAIPAGTYISGEVTESKRPGRVKGRAELGVKFTTMILPNAYMVNLNASPGGAAGTGGGETMDKEGKISGDSDKASDIGTIAKTTGAGAGIGGLATQSAKGAGIGAGIGAAAGIAAVLMSRGPEAELPRGSTLDAVINRPIFLDSDKAQFTGPGQASTLPGPPNREPQRNRMPF